MIVQPLPPPPSTPQSTHPGKSSELTKVSDLDAGDGVQQQVFRLEVTVNDHVAVTVPHPRDDLLEEARKQREKLVDYKMRKGEIL